MNTFGKICACMAFVLGVVLLILGVMGAFVGCNAHFSLPPILDVVPALVGWGVVKPIIVAWKNSSLKIPPVSAEVLTPSGPLRPRPVPEDRSNPPT
jgi:hypothetical protein